MITLVYLHREPEGYQRFVNAYISRDPEAAHTLAILCKGGAARQSSVAPLQARHVCYKQVSDWGYSLRAFRKAVPTRRVLDDHDDVYVFLNSWSEPLRDGWLAKLAAPLQDGAVGLVGATASYESFHTSDPSWRTRWLYPPFPNPHVRTNAFAMRAGDLRRAWPQGQPGPFKWQEYAFEAGYWGLTRRVQSLGLRPVVADRDGAVWEIPEWRSSRTFRHSSQEWLLVGDNQTRQFSHGTRAEKHWLAKAAWGDGSWLEKTADVFTYTFPKANAAGVWPGLALRYAALESLATKSHRLMALLGQQAGPTDDWPIDLRVTDDAAAERLRESLQDVDDQLKALGMPTR